MTYGCRRTAEGGISCDTLRTPFLEVGMNLPWIDCGWDFGDPPISYKQDHNIDGYRQERRAKWDAKLDNFQAAGIRIVRFWVLGNGINYPPRGDHRAHYDTHAQRMRPSAIVGLPQSFIEDYEYVLDAMQRRDLKALPSLVAYSWCDAGTPSVGGRHVKGGRGNWLEDAQVLGHFLDATLEPLLGAQHPEAVFAWEVINEPEWNTQGWRPEGGHRSAMVTPAVMERFMGEALTRIHRAGFVGSIGFAHIHRPSSSPSEAFYRQLRDRALDPPQPRSGPRPSVGYLHQFHFYPRQRQAVPPHDDPRHRGLPCAVGEFATAPAWWRPPYQVRGNWEPHRHNQGDIDDDEGLSGRVTLAQLGDVDVVGPWQPHPRPPTFVHRERPPDPELDARGYLLGRLRELHGAQYLHALLWSAQDPFECLIGGETLRFRRDIASEWTGMQDNQVRSFTNTMNALRGGAGVLA